MIQQGLSYIDMIDGLFIDQNDKDLISLLKKCQFIFEEKT